MATITTAVNPSLQLLQFDTLASPELGKTGVPRARALFNQNFSTTGTGAGDNEDLVISCELPINYFYRPLSCALTFYNGPSSELGSWDNGNVRGEIVSNLSATYYVPFDWNPTVTRFAAGGAGHYTAANPTVAGQNLFSQIIDGRSSTTIPVPPELTLRLHNNDASQAAVSGNIYASFLQYDIEQGIDWPLFYPGNALS